MTLDRGWPSLAAAAVAGAFAAFGQAPYDIPLALFAGLVAVFWLAALRTTTRQMALTGWAFGLGYFAHALQWIVSPFLVDVARHGWMAPFALLFMSAGLALFWGAAFWTARHLSARTQWPLILTWTTAELIRAYIFTGFPWAMPAQALVNETAGQSLAWIGPYALNALVFGGAAIAACAFCSAQRVPLRLFQAAIVLVGLITLMIPVTRSPAALTPHTVRLIQPNAAQHEKWDPAQIPVFFKRQLEFTAAPPLQGNAAPDLILWSETAIPWALDYATSPLAQIAQSAGSATVALGVLRREDVRHYNALAVLDPSGEVVQTYDKHHLVPFGEYMPFGDVLARFGIYGLAQDAGFGYSTGPGAQVLDMGSLGKALPLICYEAVFAHDVNATPERPDFVMQVTNDAWFGRAAGPEQHLAQARMRAIEQGLPVARSANTGISAMIDPYGRLTAALPLNQAGFVDARLPAPLPPTPYSLTGDLPFAIILAFGCAIAAWRVRSHQPRFSD